MWHKVFQGGDVRLLPSESLVAFMDEIDAYVDANLRNRALRDLCLHMRELAGQIRMLHMFATDRRIFDPQVNQLVQELCGYRLTAENRELGGKSASGIGRKGGKSRGKKISADGEVTAIKVIDALKSLYGEKQFSKKHPRGTAKQILRITKLDRTEQQVNTILREFRKRSALLSRD